MKLRSKHHNEEGFNFWQPASDMFSALLLILMLVILLLGLYLVQIPRYNLPDPAAGNTYAGEPDSTDATPTTTPFIVLDAGGSGGGGMFIEEGNGMGYEPMPTTSPSPTITPTPTPTPTPIPIIASSGGGGGEGGGNGAGEGPGEEPDMGMKSAVLVMTVDGDTERTIKEAGILFELYGNDHALMVLNTYYPERVTYRNFQTTEAGTFYLPEKLFAGNYELHNLSEPEGYDPADNVKFTLAETYDWDDPLVVLVPMYPSRNIIRVQMNDAETGRPLSGGSFDVIASENVITSDGTLRYRQGQVVSEIVLDEKGQGTSDEIYLGEYTVRQREIPQYYVALDEDIAATVKKKTGNPPAQHVVSSERTKIQITLRDEYYDSRNIGGASFRVTVPNSEIEPFEVTTDSRGQILLDSLEKGVTYQITQTSSAKDYRFDRTPYSFVVDKDGLIDGEATASLELLNHVIRVSIGITDEFSTTQVPNINLSLFRDDGTLIRSWATTGDVLSFTDLEPGNYYIYRDGDTSTRYDFVVEDVAEPQLINLQTSYLMRYLIMGGSATLVLALIVGLVIFIVRRRRKKRGY